MHQSSQSAHTAACAAAAPDVHPAGGALLGGGRPHGGPRRLEPRLLPLPPRQLVHDADALLKASGNQNLIHANWLYTSTHQAVLRSDAQLHMAEIRLMHKCCMLQPHARSAAIPCQGKLTMSVSQSCCSRRLRCLLRTNSEPCAQVRWRLCAPYGCRRTQVRLVCKASKHLSCISEVEDQHGCPAGVVTLEQQQRCCCCCSRI